jgi:hypothetical protein
MRLVKPLVLIRDTVLGRKRAGILAIHKGMTKARTQDTVRGKKSASEKARMLVSKGAKQLVLLKVPMKVTSRVMQPDMSAAKSQGFGKEDWSDTMRGRMTAVALTTIIIAGSQTVVGLIARVMTPVILVMTRVIVGAPK